eukprot:scaffold2.g6893.t1
MSRGTKRAAAAPPAPPGVAATKQPRAGGAAADAWPRVKEHRQAGTVDLGEGAAVDYFPGAIAAGDAARLLEALRCEPRLWARREIRIFGRSVLQPRMVGYCADPGLTYTYSGATLAPSPWPPAVLELRARVEALLQQQRREPEQQRQAAGGAGAGGGGREPGRSGRQARAGDTAAAPAAGGAGEGGGASSSRFNSCLLNWYRSGDDHIAWHSDNEPLYGPEPTIVSVSLGTTREFVLRRNGAPGDKHAFHLASGDVLVMRGTTQQHWMHSLPKRKGAPGDRISLTFRQVVAAERPRNAA